MPIRKFREFWQLKRLRTASHSDVRTLVNRAATGKVRCLAIKRLADFQDVEDVSQLMLYTEDSNAMVSDSALRAMQEFLPTPPSWPRDEQGKYDELLEQLDDPFIAKVVFQWISSNPYPRSFQSFFRSLFSQLLSNRRRPPIQSLLDLVRSVWPNLSEKETCDLLARGPSDLDLLIAWSNLSGQTHVTNPEIPHVFWPSILRVSRPQPNADAARLLLRQFARATQSVSLAASTVQAELLGNIASHIVTVFGQYPEASGEMIDLLSDLPAQAGTCAMVQAISPSTQKHIEEKLFDYAKHGEALDQFALAGDSSLLALLESDHGDSGDPPDAYEHHRKRLTKVLLLSGNREIIRRLLLEEQYDRFWDGIGSERLWDAINRLFQQEAEVTSREEESFFLIKVLSMCDDATLESFLAQLFDSQNGRTVLSDVLKDRFTHSHRVLSAERKAHAIRYLLNLDHPVALQFFRETVLDVVVGSASNQPSTIRALRKSIWSRLKKSIRHCTEEQKRSAILAGHMLYSGEKDQEQYQLWLLRISAKEKGRLKAFILNHIRFDTLATQPIMRMIQNDDPVLEQWWEIAIDQLTKNIKDSRQRLLSIAEVFSLKPHYDQRLIEAAISCLKAHPDGEWEEVDVMLGKLFRKLAGRMNQAALADYRRFLRSYRGNYSVVIGEEEVHDPGGHDRDPWWGKFNKTETRVFKFRLALKHLPNSS